MSHLRLIFPVNKSLSSFDSDIGSDMQNGHDRPRSLRNRLQGKEGGN